MCLYVGALLLSLLMLFFVLFCFSFPFCRKVLKKFDKWTTGVSGREYFTSLVQTQPWINGDRAHGVRERGRPAQGRDAT